MPPQTQPTRGAPPPRRVTYTVSESPTFAIITLLCYLFVWPAGFILNIIGLFTGPRRGCFVAMFCVFFVLPLVLIAIAVVARMAAQ